MPQYLRALVTLPEDSHYLYGGSQPSVILVLRDLKLSSGLHGCHMGVVHRGTHRQNNHTHTVKRNFKITKVSNRLYPILLHSMISYK